LSTVMFDGRESSAATGTTKILYSNYPTSLLNDLAHQSVDATINHAQGDGTRPTPAEQQQIVNFEMALFTAQTIGNYAGRLDAHGANGGPIALTTQPFFISINSSVNPLVPTLETPGGLVAPGDHQFIPAIFNPFDAWASLPDTSPRAAVARGQATICRLAVWLPAAFPHLREPAAPATILRTWAIIPFRRLWTLAPATPALPTLRPIWEALI